MEYTQEAAGGSRVCALDPFEKLNLRFVGFFSLFFFTLSSHREKHDEFGDVKKVVTDEFVRQK